MNIGPPEAGLGLCVFSHLQLHSSWDRVEGRMGLLAG